MTKPYNSATRTWLARIFLIFFSAFMLSPILYLLKESVTEPDSFSSPNSPEVFSFNSWRNLFGKGVVAKWYDAIYFSPGDLDTLDIGVQDGLAVSIQPDGTVTAMPPEPWLLRYPAVELTIFAEGLSNTSELKPKGHTLTITTDVSAQPKPNLLVVHPDYPVSAQLDMPSYSDLTHRIQVNYEFIWYRAAFTSQTFEVIGNSIKLALSASVIVLLMSTLLAYALIRLKIVLKAPLTGLVLAAQMFPSFLLITTYANIFFWLGEYIPWLGRDSHISVLLIYLGSITLSVFLVLGYFKQVDVDMEESAFVDGATPFQALWHILLPLSKPIIAVTFLVSFIYFYSEFNIANRMLTGDNLTFAAFTMEAGFYSNPSSLRSAMLLVSCVPVLVLFAFIRRHLISGLAEGSTKG